MASPTLKRIRISSPAELAAWLGNSSVMHDAVMLITHSTPSHPKHVSREAVREAALAHGWVPGPRYTQAKGLIGHVIRRGVA